MILVAFVSFLNLYFEHFKKTKRCQDHPIGNMDHYISAISV